MAGGRRALCIGHQLNNTRCAFIFHWEKSYNGPVLYSFHFDEMTGFCLLIAVACRIWNRNDLILCMDGREMLHNKLVLCSLLNRDISYGMLELFKAHRLTYWNDHLMVQILTSLVPRSIICSCQQVVLLHILWNWDFSKCGCHLGGRPSWILKNTKRPTSGHQAEISSGHVCLPNTTESCVKVCSCKYLNLIMLNLPDQIPGLHS